MVSRKLFLMHLEKDLINRPDHVAVIERTPQGALGYRLERRR